MLCINQQLQSKNIIEPYINQLSKFEIFIHAIAHFGRWLGYFIFFNITLCKIWVCNNELASWSIRILLGFNM